MELLVSHGADLVATNENGQTPADLAKAQGHNNIATSLEAKMVFTVSVCVSVSVVIIVGFSARRIWLNQWTLTQSSWKK